MDMQSRNQYLLELRSEYLASKSKKKRGELLDEAVKRTKLERKYLTQKLKSKSNLDTKPIERKKKKEYYDNSIKPALVTMWRIFDRSCGQRLETSLKDETDRLRTLGELVCSDEITEKLKKISSATIDRKLKHQREIDIAHKKYSSKINPLLFHQIPVKVFEEQDRDVVGNMQIDLVEHCGASASGEYANTLDTTDIFSGWAEQEAVMGKGQEATRDGLDNCKNRCPFSFKGIHSDGGKNFINFHLLKYSTENNIDFSRSRPYKKNDNCLVEQKNWTHVRKNVGYYRYDTLEELSLLNDLYRNELRLYKNFFSPVIKLVLKERSGGRIHRKYDKPKTPYARLMESVGLSEEKKQELKQIYLSLNPAELKRIIDKKLNNLYGFYKQKMNKEKDDANIKVDKNNLLKVNFKKKISVKFYDHSKNAISV
jgi:hypothetical protein